MIRYWNLNPSTVNPTDWISGANLSAYPELSNVPITRDSSEVADKIIGLRDWKAFERIIPNLDNSEYNMRHFPLSVAETFLTKRPDLITIIGISALKFGRIDIYNLCKTKGDVVLTRNTVHFINNTKSLNFLLRENQPSLRLILASKLCRLDILMELGEYDDETIHCAIRHNRHDIVDWLIARRAKFDMVNTGDIRTLSMRKRIIPT
jgi:hypothetical protein